MEIKKNSEANNENLRVPIMFMGLLFVSGVLLASFTYKVGEVDDTLADSKVSAVNNDIQTLDEEPEEIEQPDEPEVQAPPPPAEDIDIQENTQEEDITQVAPQPPAPVHVIDTPLPPPEIFDFPDVEAKFPGGSAELQRWIRANVQYPETSIEMEDQGRVFLTFVVEPSGAITGVKVTKKVTRELDREASRVVRRMPNWVPGEVAGKRVRTRCSIPIVFTLQ